MDRNLVSGINRTIDIVALRKESVDRNSIFDFLNLSNVCRSPQGERG